jgi:acetolactate synthase I/II/III large subunit
MTGQELSTATAWRLGRPERGRGKLVSIVVDNGAYGTIRMHQERAFPARVSGSELCNPDFVAFAQAFGWHATSVRRTEDFEPALQRALSASLPTLLHLPIELDIITTRARLSQWQRPG